jgi:hypothetical protein
VTISCSIEYGVFISHGIWLLRTRKLRRRAKEADCSFDEFPEAIEWQQNGFKWKSLIGKSLSYRQRRQEHTCPDNEQGADRHVEHIELQGKLT